MCQSHHLSENFRKRQYILSMQQVNGRNSQAQAWILRARGLQKPTGSPLYSYHVYEEECASLTLALSTTPQQLYSPVYGPA